MHFEVRPTPGGGEKGIFTMYANNPKLCGGSQGPVLVRSFP